MAIRAPTVIYGPTIYQHFLNTTTLTCAACKAKSAVGVGGVVLWGLSCLRQGLDRSASLQIGWRWNSRTQADLLRRAQSGGSGGREGDNRRGDISVRLFISCLVVAILICRGHPEIRECYIFLLPLFVIQVSRTTSNLQHPHTRKHLVA